VFANGAGRNASRDSRSILSRFILPVRRDEFATHDKGHEMLKH
jgi:hypothetical protein